MGKKRIYKTGYIIVQVNENGDIVDTLDATFDRATAEEMVMEYAYEWLYRFWYYTVHGQKWSNPMVAITENKLIDAPIEIKEIKWYE